MAGALPPQSSMLNSALAKIGDQKGTSSCVGWSISQAAYLTTRQREPFAEFPSPTVAYVLGRVRAGDNPRHLVDVGSIPISVVDAATEWGLLSMKTHPFSESTINTMLPWDEIEKASVCTSAWQRFGFNLDTRANEIKSFLAANVPVIFGMTVTDKYMNLGMHQVFDGDPGGTVRGGHMQCITDYDGDEVIVAGSWGTGFADRGFARITLRELCSSHSYSDFYAIVGAPKELL
jgi:hypothetical protein